MRMDVICDGKAIGRFDFQCHPSKGESIVTDSGHYVIDELRHNFTDNRVQVLCNKANERPKPAKHETKPTTVQP